MNRPDTIAAAADEERGSPNIKARTSPNGNGDLPDYEDIRSLSLMKQAVAVPILSARLRAKQNEQEAKLEAERSSLGGGGPV